MVGTMNRWCGSCLHVILTTQTWVNECESNLTCKQHYNFHVTSHFIILSRWVTVLDHCTAIVLNTVPSQVYLLYRILGVSSMTYYFTQHTSWASHIFSLHMERARKSCHSMPLGMKFKSHKKFTLFLNLAVGMLQSRTQTVVQGNSVTPALNYN
jgi:hypothetical protein